MLFMLVPMLLASVTLPLSAVAQTGPDLTIHADRTSYGATETVRLIVQNHGAQEYRGHLNVSLHNLDAPEDDHKNNTPYYINERDVTIPANGGNATFTWDQTNRKTGEHAHRGTYEAMVGWQRDATFVHETSPTFQLQETSTATTPGSTGLDVQLDLPLHGTLSPTRDIRVRFVVESSSELTSVKLSDNETTLLEKTAFRDPARYTHDRTYTLPPGDHSIFVLAFDERGRSASDWANITIPKEAVASPGGPLRVSTDRPTYAPGDGIEVLIQNTVNRTLEGPPLFEILGPDGRVVWHQQATGEEPLGPYGTHRFTWDQRTDSGERVPMGTYRLRVAWAPADATTSFAILPGGTFDLRLLAPEPGSGQQDSVTFSLDVGQPGASHVQLRIANGQANFTREQSFPEPVSGIINRTIDLSGAPDGTYRATVQARGPGGTAQATTWFRLLPDQDTGRPQLVLLHPGDGDHVPRLFPVVFGAEDDTGITYAEAYLDGELVGRQAWPHPVQRGAFPARIPSDMTGAHDLRVVVYDTGKNQDAALLELSIGPTMPACAEVLAQAHALATNTTPEVPGVPTPTATNASAEAGFTFPCPTADRGTGDRHERGDFGYARSIRGLTDVEVRGYRVFEKVTFEDGDRADLFAAMDLRTRGRFMVFDAEERGNVTWDLNSTWVAFQRGEHVVLENTRDGSRVLLVMHEATPTVLGQRLTAQLEPGATVVVRPLAQGEVDQALADSIVEGRVGAEVAIQGGGEPETVSYGDLQVVARQETRRVTATLSTDQHQGRTVVLTLAENATLGDELEVLLDGHAVEAADRLEDVLGMPDPNQPSLYYVVQDDGQTKVIVQVNHFSTRELVVQAADIAERFLGPIAIIGGLALTVAAAAGLFRRQEI